MKAILVSFAAPDGAPNALPLVPWAVLGRQLARLVVLGLDRGGDRGVRFLPLIGPLPDGRRGFLEPEQMVPADTLLDAIGGRFAVDLVIAGELADDRLLLRWSDPADRDRGGRCHVGFDAAEPWTGVRAAVFELAGVLGVPDDPAPLPALQGSEARSHHLLGLDAQLALEARLIDDRDPERGLLHALALLHLEAAPVGWSLLLDIARHAVRHGVAGPRTVEALAAFASPLALREPRPGPQLQSGAARLLLAVDQPAAALELLERACAAGLDDPDTLLDLSHAAARSGAAERCRPALRRAVEGGCTDLRVRAQLAACEELGGDAERRAELIAGCLRDLDAGSPPAVIRICASWQIDAGAFAPALAVLDDAVRRHPQHHGLWLERGRALLGLYRADLARESLQRALQLEPPPEARDEIRRLMPLTRGDGLLMALGGVWSCLDEGDLRLAWRRARALCRAHGEAAEAWLAAGVVAMRRRRRRAARRALQRAVGLAPDLAEAHARLGALYAERGALEEAWSRLCRATELAPHDAAFWAHRGQIAHRLGRIDEAREALRRAEAIGTPVAPLQPLRELLGVG